MSAAGRDVPADQMDLNACLLAEVVGAWTVTIVRYQANMLIVLMIVEICSRICLVRYRNSSVHDLFSVSISKGILSMHLSYIVPHIGFICEIRYLFQPLLI